MAAGTSPTEHAAQVRRAIDVVASSVLLILLAPIMMVIALAIRVRSAGPPMYRVRRVSRGGREFEVVRFKMLRRSRVQLVPQLINVIRGDMKLGRPVRRRGVEIFDGSLSHEAHHRTPGPHVAWAPTTRTRGTRRLGCGRPAARRTTSAAQRDGPDDPDLADKQLARDCHHPQGRWRT